MSRSHQRSSVPTAPPPLNLGCDCLRSNPTPLKLPVRALFYGARSSLQFAFERIVGTHADRWWRSGGDMSSTCLKLKSRLFPLHYYNRSLTGAPEEIRTPDPQIS